MKYMKSFLTWVLLLAATHVMALTVTVNDVQFKPGGTAEIVVNLANTETTLSGYQMSLYLPAGITLQTDDDDDYICILSGRHKSDHQMAITVNQNDGSLLLVCFSISKKVISGTSGELFRLPVNIASTVTSSVQGSFKNILFGDKTNNSYPAADATINFTLIEKEEQTLSLTALPEMTEGDAAYTLPTQTSQSLALTWSVADATIASISGNMLTPLKAGTTTVTTTQAGNDDYLPFTRDFTLTVKEKPVQTDPDTDISLLDNTIYINRIEARAGETVIVSVKMKNSFLVEGFGFDLVLPEGITVAIDEYGDPVAELSYERTNASITNIFNADFKLDGSLNIQAYSTKGRTISGYDGEVARITIKLSDDMESGEYPIVLKNIAITDENSSTITVQRVKSTLEVPAYIIGDANNDGNVNVGDLTAISHYILERPDASFHFQAADANQDGNVNVGDLTAVSHLILWGSIVRPQAAPSIINQQLDPQ